MDENYNPDIVSVVDEDGVEHIFEELDRIETDDARYVALLPVYDEAEEILEDDGELIILKVSEEDGETYLEPIEDEDEFNAVFEKCMAAMEEEDAMADALELEPDEEDGDEE